MKDTRLLRWQIDYLEATTFVEFAENDRLLKVPIGLCATRRISLFTTQQTNSTQAKADQLRGKPQMSEAKNDFNKGKPT